MHLSLYVILNLQLIYDSISQLCCVSVKHVRRWPNNCNINNNTDNDYIVIISHSIVKIVSGSAKHCLLLLVIL